MEREQREARQSPLNTSCPLWSFYLFSLFLSSAFYIVLVLLLYLCISWLFIDIAWDPCYATLLMTILLISTTEAAVRDGSHALQLNMLPHAHMLVRRDEKRKGNRSGGIWTECGFTDVMTQSRIYFRIEDLSILTKYISTNKAQIKGGIGFSLNEWLETN